MKIVGIIICRKNHANGKGTETGGEGYEPSLENDAKNIKDATLADEWMINHDKIPINACENQTRATTLNLQTCPKRTKWWTQALNHMASAIDNSYTYDSVKV